MRNTILVLFLLLCATLSAQQRPDILGGGFTSECFDMGQDYSGAVKSTLVRTLPIERGRDAVLYIHGYNDYFFQADMARRFQDSAYNFYAVDLRRYGRSLEVGQTPFEVRDLREYFADIESAIGVIRGEGAERIILMGHSTGGLIASYYVGERGDESGVGGLILNSPFFAQNVGWAMQNVLLPVVSFIGYYLPDLQVVCDHSTLYYDSLHKASKGEWAYDTSLKMPISPPITAGWIRAIDLAQQSVQRGGTVSVPVLLLYSDNSVYTSVWSDDMLRGDAVLNVEHIAKYGSKLGDKVTQAQIKGAMHDVVLSGYDAREEAYRAIFEWLYVEF